MSKLKFAAANGVTLSTVGLDRRRVLLMRVRRIVWWLLWGAAEKVF